MSNHIALSGEEEASELLELLSSVPCALPQDWAPQLQILQCWSEESNLTLSTLLRLCAALPSLRYIDVCSLSAPADDIPSLTVAIRTANAFANVANFQLGQYRARDMPLTAVYAMVESMPTLRHLRLDVVPAPAHNAERDDIQQLDIAHIHLRTYACNNECVGWDLPIKHSSETLERLEIYLDDETPVERVESLLSTLRSQDFTRLHRLSLINDAEDTPCGAIGGMLSILKGCPHVRRLLVRCHLSDLQALLDATTLPLYELAVCAAHGTVREPAAVDSGLAAICACLTTIPTLRSLRRLRIISDSDDSELHEVDAASESLRRELKRTCAERRISLITFEDWHITTLQYRIV